VLLVIESPLLAAHFTREMDRLWRGAELGINGRLASNLAANPLQERSLHSYTENLKKFLRLPRVKASRQGGMAPPDIYFPTWRLGGSYGKQN